MYSTRHAKQCFALLYCYQSKHSKKNMTGNISLRRLHHIILLISLSTELTGDELTDSIFPTHCSSSSIQTSCQLPYVNRRSFSVILFLFRIFVEKLFSFYCLTFSCRRPKCIFAHRCEYYFAFRRWVSDSKKMAMWN